MGLSCENCISFVCNEAVLLAWPPLPVLWICQNWNLLTTAHHQLLQVCDSSGEGEGVWAWTLNHWHYHHRNHHHHQIHLNLVHMTSQWEVELNRLYLDVIPHSNRQSEENVPEKGRDKPYWISTSPCPSQPITQPIPFFCLFLPSQACILLLCLPWSNCAVLMCFGVMCLCAVSSFLTHNKPARPEINYSKTDSQRGSYLIVRTHNITTWYQVRQ